jgi:hypothetical protein
MGMQIASAIRNGTDGLSLSMYALALVSMALWCWLSMLGEEGIELSILLSNGCGVIGSTIICLLIIFYHPTGEEQGKRPSSVVLTKATLQVEVSDIDGEEPR